MLVYCSLSAELVAVLLQPRVVDFTIVHSAQDLYSVLEYEYELLMSVDTASFPSPDDHVSHPGRNLVSDIVLEVLDLVVDNSIRTDFAERTWDFSPGDVIELSPLDSSSSTHGSDLEEGVESPFLLTMAFLPL